MNDLNRWACMHEWKSEGVNSRADYPCGPCPISCPECESSCCPNCGGEMGKSIDDGDEMDSYTAGGCKMCSYTCCGGCI